MNEVLVTRHGETAVLTLNRPQARNALNLPLRDALSAAINEVRDDSAVKAVVLTGAGGHFCAGGDVKGMAAGADRPADGLASREGMRAIHRWFDQLVDLEKPVIAAVEGSAFGAGLSLALAADFVLAAPGAKFCSVFSRIGLVPDLAGLYLLPRIVGLQRAKELVFSARAVDAQEALAMGMVYQITEDVQAAALALAARFHQAPTGSIGLSKAMLNRTFETQRSDIYAQEAMAQSLCRDSAYHKQAVKRFVDKQPPLYQWDKAQS